MFSLFSFSDPPPPSFFNHSLSTTLKKTLLTTLKSQQTKPWTTGINSHQQITDSTVASFPEIRNKSHMGTKCVPDARGSCVVQALLSTPQDLCYVIKNCALSYPLSNMVDIFITYCLCLLCIHFPVLVPDRGKLVIILVKPCWLMQCIDQIMFEKTDVCPRRISWNTLILDFYV